MNRSLRLLTLNIHGEPGGRDAETLAALTDFFCRERPTVVALQEVCQSREAEPLPIAPDGYREAERGVILREDLFVLQLARRLAERGERIFWSYLPIKLGYGKYDEGVALLASEPIAETSALTVSRTAEYRNWRTRRLLGGQIRGAWFYSVHFGWFEDPEEPFAEEWTRACRGLRSHGGKPIYLMGDFNSPAEVRGGGYDLVTESGYCDVWCLSSGGDGATVVGQIDGWQSGGGLRIDHIRSTSPPVKGRARLAFDGISEPAVSDHYGVYARLEGGI